jgi:hypothetical protein
VRPLRWSLEVIALHSGTGLTKVRTGSSVTAMLAKRLISSVVADVGLRFAGSYPRLPEIAGVSQ